MQVFSRPSKLTWSVCLVQVRLFVFRYCHLLIFRFALFASVVNGEPFNMIMTQNDLQIGDPNI